MERGGLCMMLLRVSLPGPMFLLWGLCIGEGVFVQGLCQGDLCPGSLFGGSMKGVSVKGTETPQQPLKQAIHIPLVTQS